MNGYLVTLEPKSIHISKGIVFFQDNKYIKQHPLTGSILGHFKKILTRMSYIVGLLF